MKKIVISTLLFYAVLVFGLWLYASMASANSVQVNLFQKNRLNDSEDFQIGNWNGIQLDYKFEKMYVFGSYESAQVIPKWGIGDMRAYGVGVGMKHKVNDHVRVFGQIGYYFINQENEGSYDISDRKQDGSEGITYHMNNAYQFTQPDKFYEFDRMKINFDDALGAEVGFELFQQFTENLEGGMSLSYAAMKVPMEIDVYRKEWDKVGAWWMEHITRDVSSLKIGAYITYNF